MPYLENTRIRLRPLEPEDLDRLYRWENDAALWIYSDTVAPFSRFALKQYIEQAAAGIVEHRQLRLIIALKGDEGKGEQVVGTVDLFDIDFLHRKAALGLLILPHAQRQGIASEVVDLIEAYAFDHLGLHQLYAYIGADNEASLALFRRRGYIESGPLRHWTFRQGAWQDVYLFQRIEHLSL